ncbi:hypothetical protein DFR88_07565 [Metallosphaera sedula]|uniref:Helix-turn-helix domain-containing protein n=1 Tax=Metallosphaera prunae TaxID=47304 RepID=A0A4D8S6A9_METPR|nr:hypothetical protein [Metallosphaera prunae]QCO30355.1 hypothetical protein DFR88_07565 [Metallosphaera prunae]
MRAVHNISKECREKIVALLLEKRSKSELARDLGVSPASIVKFYKGRTHASDLTILRALSIADEEEKKYIARLIMDDLAESLLDLLSENQDLQSEKLDILKKVLDERDKRKILTSLGLV